MTYIVSKVVGIFLSPLNLIVLFIAVGLVASKFFHAYATGRRLGKVSFFLAAVVFVVCGATNLPDYALYVLESRHVEVKLPENPAGIIVLGGGLDGRSTFLHGGGYELNSSADRLISGFELANKFPDIPLVYSSGISELVKDAESGAVVAQRVAAALYGPDRKFVLESKSRNTWENAVNSYALLKPQKGQIWIVVTSAFHTTRSLGCFRKAGFEVVMWPTDYYSYYDGHFSMSFDFAGQFGKTQIVLREIVGIIAYTLMGRMEWPF